MSCTMPTATTTPKGSLCWISAFRWRKIKSKAPLLQWGFLFQIASERFFLKQSSCYCVCRGGRTLICYNCLFIARGFVC
jgi:hypothetical protein